MRLGFRGLGPLLILLLASLASPALPQAPAPPLVLLGLADAASSRLVPGVYADTLGPLAMGRLAVGDVRDLDLRPDGRWLAVARADALILLDLETRREVRVDVDAATVDWAPDGSSAVVTGFFGETWSVRRVGLDGNSTVLSTSPAISDAYHLPNGSVLALRRFVSGAVHTVELVDGGPRTVRAFPVPRAAVAPDGEWFARPENATSGIVVERFDGAASRLLDDTPGRRPVSFGPQARIAWTKEGSWGVLNGPAGPFAGTLRQVAWEPSGGRLAAVVETSATASALVVLDLAGSAPETRRTLEGASAAALAWATPAATPSLLRGVPDGPLPQTPNRVAFVVAGGIRTVAPDGTDRASAHATTTPVLALRAAGPGLLAFAAEDGLWTVPWDGTAAPTLVRAGPVRDFDVQPAASGLRYVLEVANGTGSDLLLLSNGVATPLRPGSAPLFVAPGWVRFLSPGARPETLLLELSSGTVHALSEVAVPSRATDPASGLHGLSVGGRLWLAEHRAAGAAFGTRTLVSGSGGIPLAVSPDGRHLAFFRRDGEAVTVLLAALRPDQPPVTRVLASDLRGAPEAAFLDADSLLLAADTPTGRAVTLHRLASDARQVWGGANADVRLLTVFAAPPRPDGAPQRDVQLGESGDQPVRGVVRISSARPGSGSYSWSATSQGRETSLGSAPGDTGVSWDTGRERNGWYVVQARDANGTVVESATILVQNPREPTELVVATATGVGLTVGLSYVWGQMTTALAAVKSWVAQSVEEVLQNRTRRRGTVSLKARRFGVTLGLVGAAGVVLGLASTFATAVVPRFVWAEFWEMLPYVAGGVLVFYAIHQLVEHAVAVWLGSEAEFNLWGAGAVTLLFSSAAFAMPFGVPGYMDAPPHPDRRMEGRRALGTILGLVAAMAPFAALAWWRFDVYEAGAGTALGIAVSLLAPVSTLPGRMLWRWTRVGWAALTVAGLAVFWAYEMALGGPLVFAAIGIVSAAGLAATMLWRSG